MGAFGLKGFGIAPPDRDWETKRRGRSATIMTGPMGVEEEQLTLGTKSLLGQ